MNQHLTSIWESAASLAEGNFNQKKPLPKDQAPAQKPTAAFNRMKKSQVGKHWGETKPVDTSVSSGKRHTSSAYHW